MAVAGRVRCDFCSFVGDMEAMGLNKGAMQVPIGWISIHPMVVVHGMRGIKRRDPKHSDLEKIKNKIKKQVRSMHACPGCAVDRDIFSMQLALPPAAQEAYENPMKERAANV